MSLVKIKSIPKLLIVCLRGESKYFLSYYIFWVFVASASKFFDGNWMPNEYAFIDQMKQQIVMIYSFLGVLLCFLLTVKHLRKRQMESNACRDHIFFSVLNTMVDEMTKLPFVAGGLLLAVASIGFLNNVRLEISNLFGMSKYSYSFTVELESLKNGVVLTMFGVLLRWANFFTNKSDDGWNKYKSKENKVLVSASLSAPSVSAENKKSFIYSLGNPVVDLRLFNDFLRNMITCGIIVAIGGMLLWLDHKNLQLVLTGLVLLISGFVLMVLNIIYVSMAMKGFVDGADSYSRVGRAILVAILVLCISLASLAVVTVVGAVTYESYIKIIRPNIAVVEQKS